MTIAADSIDRILALHGVRGPWQSLRATGVANHIYATADAVLRIATDHPDAVDDARTESVAGPIARAAGVLAPRLVAFDDSRTIVDRPYSVWERIHGETLGLLEPDARRDQQTWTAVGSQLARLHRRVGECADPNGWLDEPDRARDLPERLQRLASAGRIDADTAGQLDRWIAALGPAVAAPAERCFLHNDVHAMNVMCAADGTMLALIDWGDAGWGDPALEFAQAPCGAMPALIEGYESAAPDLLGEAPEARILWDKLDYALSALWEDRRLLDELLGFVRTADDRWRRVRS